MKDKLKAFAKKAKVKVDNVRDKFRHKISLNMIDFGKFIIKSAGSEKAVKHIEIVIYLFALMIVFTLVR